MRPLEHTYDKIAKRKLEDVLPISWIFKSPRESDSGFEYGEDWIVEIVEENNPTGIEFCVQNKGTSKIGKRVISVEVKVATLHRLQKLGRPIFIHIHSVTSNKSYWMWLEDFYAKNSSKWKGKKTVSVSVPITNVLDATALKHIYEYARKFHDSQSFIKRYEAISRVDPDYSLELILKDEKRGIVLHPKHDNPRPFAIKFHDPKNAELFQKALETGDSVEVAASVHLEGIIDIEVGELRIFPDTPQESFPQKLEVLSGNGEVTSLIPFLDMKLTKTGTVVDTWCGSSKTLPVVVTMIVDHRNHKLDINFNIDLKLKNPIELKNRIIFADGLINAPRIRLTNLETGLSAETNQGQIIGRNIELVDDDTRKLIFSLAKIAEKLGVLIDVPEEFSYDDLDTAQDIATVLETGLYRELNKQGDAEFIVSVVASDAEKLLENTGEDAKGLVMQGTRHEPAELFGHQLDLGPSEIVFYGKQVNFEDLRKRLQNVTDRENDLLEIQCSVDGEHSYIKYLNWFKNADAPL